MRRLRSKPRYEYQIIVFRLKDNVEEHLNNLGNEDWYIAHHSDVNTLNSSFIMCREI